RPASARELQSQLADVLDELHARVSALDIRRAIDDITGGEVTPPRGVLVARSRRPPPAPPLPEPVDDALIVNEAPAASLVVDIAVEGASPDQGPVRPDGLGSPSAREGRASPDQGPVRPVSEPSRETTYAIINPKYRERRRIPGPRLDGAAHSRATPPETDDL